MELLELSQEQKEKLDIIKKKSGVQDDRFIKGAAFAFLCTKGEPRTRAYTQAFGATDLEARSNASNLFRAKWIQELYKVFEIEDEIVLKPLRMKTIKRLEELLDSEDEKISLDAAKTLERYTKSDSRLKQETDEVVETNETVEHFKQLMSRISEIAQNGGTVNAEQEVVKKMILE